jgi:hypothetical protein
MMRADTAAILKKLSRGKSALDQAALLAFCADIRSATDNEVVEALKARVAVKKAKAPPPAWLTTMEDARKTVKWSAPEATRTLIQIAVDEGLIASDPYTGKKTPGFAVAAKKLATLSSGDALSSCFVREVARIKREYALG